MASVLYIIIVVVVRQKLKKNDKVLYKVYNVIMVRVSDIFTVSKLSQ